MNKTKIPVTQKQSQRKMMYSFISKEEHKSKPNNYSDHQMQYMYMCAYICNIKFILQSSLYTNNMKSLKKSKWCRLEKCKKVQFFIHAQ